MNQVGTLIFFCGKMGAGKSTLSQELASERRAVCISEDQWLAALFPQEIQNFGDYLKFSARLSLGQRRSARLLRFGGFGNGALLCTGKPVLKPYGQCADKADPARNLGHHSRVYLYLFPVGCGLYPAGAAEQIASYKLAGHT